MAAALGPAESFPEIDRVAWFEPDEARRRIKATQIPFIDRLEAALRLVGVPWPDPSREPAVGAAAVARCTEPADELLPMARSGAT